MDSINGWGRTQNLERVPVLDSEVQFAIAQSQSVRPKNNSYKPQSKNLKERPWESRDGIHKTIKHSRKTQHRNRRKPSFDNEKVSLKEDLSSLPVQSARFEQFGSKTSDIGRIMELKGEDRIFSSTNIQKPIGWHRSTNASSFHNTLPEENLRKFVAPDMPLGILHAKMDPETKAECVFCKRNNAKDINHPLKDSLGGVVCPILSAFTCKMCAATGRNAHTHKYCPVNPITKGDPVAAGMPPGRPLTKVDKQWLKYFHARFILEIYKKNNSKLFNN